MRILSKFSKFFVILYFSKICKIIIFALHKVLVIVYRSFLLKKLAFRKFRYRKIVNNHKILNHKFWSFPHKVSKELESIYSSLIPIYEELEDLTLIDLVDLEFYERWLNGRY